MKALARLATRLDTCGRSADSRFPPLKEMGMEVRRSPELEQLGRDSHAAGERQDDAWFRANTATGQIFMAGTAPGETARGIDEVFRTSLKRWTEAQAAIGMRHEAGEPEAYKRAMPGSSLRGKFVFDDGATSDARNS